MYMYMCTLCIHLTNVHVYHDTTGFFTNSHQDSKRGVSQVVEEDIYCLPLSPEVAGEGKLRYLNMYAICYDVHVTAVEVAH